MIYAKNDTKLKDTNTERIFEGNGESKIERNEKNPDRTNIYMQTYANKPCDDIISKIMGVFTYGGFRRSKIDGEEWWDKKILVQIEV